MASNKKGLPHQKIINEYQSGMSMVDISKQYECDPSAIGYILKKFGIVTRSSRKLDYEYIKDEYISGKPTTYIARALKTSPNAVANALKAQGIKRREPRSYLIGRKQPRELVAKRCESLIGKPRPSWIADLIRKVNTGRKRTPEQRKAMSERMMGLFSGEKHPNWMGGKSFEEYPQFWKEKIREQIRTRDQRKCQICGVPEMECTSRLDVHHIDYNKRNVSDENLIALCRPCHTKTGFNRDSWKEFFNKKKVSEQWASSPTS